MLHRVRSPQLRHIHLPELNTPSLPYCLNTSEGRRAFLHYSLVIVIIIAPPDYVNTYGDIVLGEYGTQWSIQRKL